MLCHQIMELGEYVHIKFGIKKELITEVEEGRLLYAIIPDEINTFDTICHPFLEQKLTLVATPDIDLGDVKKLYKKDPVKTECLLTNQKWYAHDSASSYIKHYWLHVFDKKRPAVVPNYVIPNEFETLYQLSRGSGLSVALDTNATPFIKEGTLKVYDLKEIVFRKLSLISNKKKAPLKTTKRIVDMLCRTTN